MASKLSGLLRASLALVAGLALVACAEIAKMGEPQDPAYPVNGPELVIRVEGKDGDGTLVYALNMRKAPLIYPFIRVAEQDVYNGIYISRNVPGLLVESEDGRWHSRNIPPAFTPQPPKLGEAKSGGEIGLIAENGMIGPRLLLMRGRTFLEPGLVPPNESLGKLVSGEDVLNRLVKGDKIVEVYGRKFPNTPDPY